MTDDAASDEVLTIAQAGGTKRGRTVQGAVARNLSAVDAAAEVELKETDDRFTPPELISAFEDAFGEIDCDPCWHVASKVRPSGTSTFARVATDSGAARRSG